MTPEQKREVVIRNKGKGTGRGRKRDVVVTEKAQCSDSLGLRTDKPFMTKKQFLVSSIWLCLYAPRFIDTLKSRYNWTDADYENEWNAALSNPNAVWSRDEYNEPIVSLLRAVVASNCGELTHNKELSRSEVSAGDDLEATFTRAFFQICLQFTSEFAEVRLVVDPFTRRPGCLTSPVRSLFMGD